ncbi:hypothetical protein LCL97_13845 [Seohaeicola saemankumensis]|nr:calcium-binding protein [Seohaeicola saemankumensis]MCA0871917.1 hypothetical protein [Seohaeicola saemankumensis]
MAEFWSVLDTELRNVNIDFGQLSVTLDGNIFAFTTRPYLGAPRNNGVGINDLNDGDRLSMMGSIMADLQGVLFNQDDGLITVGNLGVISAGTIAIDAQGEGISILNNGILSAIGNGVNLNIYGDMVNNGDIVAEGIGINAFGTYSQITNSGSVHGQLGGIALGGFSYLNNSGYIYGNNTGVHISSHSSNLRNTGSIESNNVGLHTQAGVIIENAGTIGGLSVGVNFYAGTRSSLLHNSGEIIAGAVGVQVSASTKIFNEGSILASSTGGIGIKAVATMSGGVKINNTGHIEGDTVAIDLQTSAVSSIKSSGTINGDVLLGDGADRLVNRGMIDGSVDMGDGADFVLNSGVVTGDILLGRGDDVFVGTNGSVDGIVDGGIGRDTLTGGNADDTLLGGAGNDNLAGRAGDDDLSGGNGRDTLDGGTGNDRLTGGAHGDVFVFQRHAGDDIITDFVDGVDRIDLSAFSINPANISTVIAALSDDGSGNTLLDLSAIGGNGSVLITGLDIADAGASDFIL